MSLTYNCRECHEQQHFHDGHDTCVDCTDKMRTRIAVLEELLKEVQRLREEGEVSLNNAFIDAINRLKKVDRELAEERTKNAAIFFQWLKDNRPYASGWLRDSDVSEFYAATLIAASKESR